MTAADRLALVRRLRPGEAVRRTYRSDFARARKRRAAGLTVTALSTALLAPWTIYLAVSLPDRYVSHSWALTWVGFDLLLTVMLGLTAFFAWKRRVLVVLTSFASGVLLLADSWFDVTTSDAGDLHLSIASAALIEIPLAVFLLGTGVVISLRIARLLNLMTGDAVRGRWRMPINEEIVLDASSRPRGHGADVSHGPHSTP